MNLYDLDLRKYAALTLQTVLPLLFLGACSYMLMQPIFELKGWYYTHDVGRMPYLTMLFRESFEHGNWFPRWVPELMGGYGYPTYLFYQSGFFFLSLPFTYFFPLLWAMKLELFFILTAGGLGAYMIAREFLASRTLALFATMFFMVTPYISTNMNPRGAYAELLAQLIVPIGVWLLMRLYRSTLNPAATKKSMLWAIAFALSLAGVIYSHPFTTMFYGPMLGVLALGCYVQTPGNIRFLLLSLLAVLLGLVLAAPYWMTILTLGDLVTLENSRWFFGPPDDWKGFVREYFNPGYWHMLAAGFAFALGGWRKPLILAATICYCFFLFMMSSYSASIWEMRTPLRFIQFPWRINSVACTAQYLIILFGLQTIWNWRFAQKRRKLTLGVLCLALLGGSFYTMYNPYKAMEGDWENFRRPRYQIFDGISYRDMLEKDFRSKFTHLSVGRGDFTPKRAKPEGLFNRNRHALPIAEVFPDRAGRLTFSEDSTEYHPRFTFRFATNGPVNRYIDNLKAPPTIIREPAGEQLNSAVLINQFYLPGWVVLIDGKPIPFVEYPGTMPDKLVWGPGKNGRIRINFPAPGAYDVQAWYEGPPGWMLRNLVVVALSAWLLFAMRMVLSPKFDSLTHNFLRRLRSHD